ncbi:hypothetical protein OAK67_01510 [Crocinitomicaceae bacterium]|nr:hypothetical protein [Crocinitomicaceae bacterium]
MQTIKNNPFRIAGLLANATEREILRQKSKSEAYISVGKEIETEVDYECVGTITRTEESLQKSFSDINQNQNRLEHALFWFTNEGPYDELAFGQLKAGEEQKAIEIWTKVTKDKDVKANQFSCFNNLSTYKLLSQNKEDLKDGIALKIKLIESVFFKDFVHLVADRTLSFEKDNIVKKFIDILFIEFKKNFNTKEIYDLFELTTEKSKEYLIEKITSQPIRKIEQKIDDAKEKRKKNKIKAYKFGLELYDETKNEISLLIGFLPKSNLSYISIADKLANEIMQCGIDYFNDSQDIDSSEPYNDHAQELNKFALSIAVGQLTKDRAQDSIKSLEEIKDSFIRDAVNLLDQVKKAYEENKSKVNAEVEKIKREHPFGFAPINWTAVKESIANSIDWDKVNELIKEVLSQANLAKIKSSSNHKLKANFLELTQWLLRHTQKKTAIKKIISDYKKIPPKLGFKIISAKVTNTDNKPFYTKYIEYISLEINVQVKQKSSIQFYLKYIDPDGDVAANNKSPDGYTNTSIKELNTDVKTIIFPRWGDKDDYYYETGEHFIELYVDEYMLISEKFKVDLSPSDKLKKKLKSAESKLKRIEKKIFLEREIKHAKIRMGEIKEFHWFRLPSERERQIEQQQNRISTLEKRATEMKKTELRVLKEEIEKLEVKLRAAKD